VNRVRVKICGLCRREDALRAVEAGADYLGFVFAPGSPRRVRADDIAPWLDEVRLGAELVGVFRDQEPREVEALVEGLDLDLVQLHGREEGEAWLRLPVRVVEARPVGAVGVAASRLGEAAWADLLDTEDPRGGGTGRSFDWTRAAAVAHHRRIFLAGGLDPGNVAAAVAAVRPFAVDVSSGVEESPGRKDAKALLDFMKAIDEGRRE
jgi:phosphoribosylanthranilate isomerase